MLKTAIEGDVKLTIRPLTPSLWPALEDLFGKKGACNGCWCMYWRIGSAYKKQPAVKNKKAFHKVVQRGPPPGLLAFDVDVAVGWCQLTPRDDLPSLDRTWRLRRVDGVPVWALSCLYVRTGYRRKGLRHGHRICLNVRSRRFPSGCSAVKRPANHAL